MTTDIPAILDDHFLTADGEPLTVDMGADFDAVDIIVGEDFSNMISLGFRDAVAVACKVLAIAGPSAYEDKGGMFPTGVIEDITSAVTRYAEQAKAKAESFSKGADMLVAAMEASGCPTVGDLFEEMSRRGISDFAEFTRTCRAEK